MSRERDTFHGSPGCGVGLGELRICVLGYPQNYYYPKTFFESLKHPPALSQILTARTRNKNWACFVCLNGKEARLYFIGSTVVGVGRSKWSALTSRSLVLRSSMRHGG